MDMKMLEIVNTSRPREVKASKMPKDNTSNMKDLLKDLRERL